MAEVTNDTIIADVDESSIITSSVPATFTNKLDLASYAFSGVATTKAEASSPRPHHSLRTTRSSTTAVLSPHSSCPIQKANPKRRPARSTALSSSRASSSPSRKAGYAPPSVYAHLPPLRDVLAPSLICVFIGLNPGLTTSSTGHAYAHPSNRFWKLLHISGCTTRLCRPEEDGDLPRLFSLGNTNIVARPTRNGGELKKGEMDEGVAVLEEKVRCFRPEAVCLVGKGIWESVWRVRRGRALKAGEFTYGWQGEGENMGIVKGKDGREEWKGARVFVSTSTSGLAASVEWSEKERIWRELGTWVVERRREREREAKEREAAAASSAGGDR